MVDSALGFALHHFVAIKDIQFVVAAFAIALLATTTVCYFLSSNDNEPGFPRLPGIQLYHARNFFKLRHDFLHSTHKQNPGQGFSFHVRHHKIVAVTGEEARRVFYSESSLNLREGVGLLVGLAPKTRNLEPESSRKRDAIRLSKWMNKLFSKPRLQNFIPVLLRDIIGKTDQWGNDGKNGKVDLFTGIFELVFLTTTRMAACDDLADNASDMKKIMRAYLRFKASATPTALILPWLPSPGRVNFVRGVLSMFFILRGYVEARRRAEPTTDAIDVMIAGGETTRGIAQFVFEVFTAGISNSSTLLCWTLIDLAVHREWREKCKSEIEELLSRHLGDPDPYPTTYDKLSAIPLSAWEEELPILDACTRESQRLAMSGALLRRNIYENINIGGKVVKRGDFVTYPTTEVHLNPEYYPAPHEYDPGRWLRPDPVPDVPYPFLGWGAGRHPCPGMKVAKFQIKLIVATLLLRCEYELVDEDGKFPNPAPVPNKGDTKLYFKFKKVME